MSSTRSQQLSKQFTRGITLLSADVLVRHYNIDAEPAPTNASLFAGLKN